MSIASRVAARWLEAGGDSAEAEAVTSQTAKVPLSGPGKQMFKGLVRKMDDAIDEEDHVGFAKALLDLHSSWKKLNPKGLEETASGGGSTAKLPRSGPGMEMFKGMMGKLVDAFDDADPDAFGKALESLYQSHEKLAKH